MNSVGVRLASGETEKRMKHFQQPNPTQECVAMQEGTSAVVK